MENIVKTPLLKIEITKLDVLNKMKKTIDFKQYFDFHGFSFGFYLFVSLWFLYWKKAAPKV
jgi:hypothetical protein